MSEERKSRNEILGNIVTLINNVMLQIDLFEENRPGNIAIERLEEAAMWCQVMTGNCKMKEPKQELIRDDEVVAMTTS